MFNSSGQTTSVTKKVCFKWSLNSFSYFSITTGDFLQSSVFPSAKSDEKWCLRIYPGGSSGISNVRFYANNEKCFSLRLVLVSSNKKEVKASVQIRILDANYEKFLENTFEQQTFLQGEECHYAISCNNLFNKSLQFLQNNVITISCEVTSLDYIMDLNEVTKVSIAIQCGPNQIFPEPELSNHFEDLFATQIFADITFRIKGQELKAHKAILASTSVVFQAMFETDMKETATNKIEITDIEFNVFKAMLHFIYTDKAPNPEMAKELLPAADKYNLNRLKALCEKDIFTNLTAENSAEVLILADLHNCSHLKSLILEFIVANVRIVMETAGWRSLEKTHPNLVAEAHKELWKSQSKI